MREILRGNGLTEYEIDMRFSMFNHYQLQEMGDKAPVKTPLSAQDVPLPTSTFAAPQED
jgi:hypothetical protein